MRVRVGWTESCAWQEYRLDPGQLVLVWLLRALSVSYPRAGKTVY